MMKKVKKRHAKACLFFFNEINPFKICEMHVVREILLRNVKCLLIVRGFCLHYSSPNISIYNPFFALANRFILCYNISKHKFEYGGPPYNRAGNLAAVPYGAFGSNRRE